MEAIKAWLNSKMDYATGVQLYTQYGKDPVLLRLFLEERSAFKEKKLQQVLRELYKANKPVQNNPPAPKPAEKKAVPKPEKPLPQKRWPAQPITDPVVLALWEQWRPLYGEKQNLKGRIYEVALQGEDDINKAGEAGLMAHRILDLDDQIEYIYAKRNFYYEHGKLPAEAPGAKPPDIVDPVKWAVKLKNNERYLREYKAKLRKTPGHKSADKWAMKIKEFKDEILKYKKLLKIE